MTVTPSFIVLLPLLLPGAQAWGDLGHETIAYIAQNFVASGTKSWAQDILGDTSTSYLANVATWADSYRYTAEGKFSAPYHFIDAEDDPPSSCNVDYDRDCGQGGCVVAAIANYTNRVQSSSVSSDEQVKALKWIVHFLGDVTQPLHDEAYEVGGNDVSVTFNGASTNLHHIYDTEMPEMLEGGYSLSVAKTWAKNLTADIKTGRYSSQKNSWVSGLDVNDAKGTSMGWAQDANAFVCSVVMPDGTDVLQSGDLATNGYYDGVIGTIELQIAKAGYRLAKWLDAIAANAGQSSKKRASIANLGLREEDLLPPPRELSPAKLRRLAVGYGCKH